MRLDRPRLWILLPLVLTIGLSATRVGAHDFTKTDGNDTGGPLDLSAVSIRHVQGGIQYKFKTFARWVPQTLGSDSFLLIAIDRDEDGTADRCAFIFYYGGRLRAAMTNCARRNFGLIPVRKPSRTTALVTIGTVAHGGTHTWAAFSFFAEARPCLRGCTDAVPNRRPLLHDLLPPVPTWVTTTSNRYFSTELSSSTTVPVQFDVSDGDTHVVSWEVQRYADAWTTIASGEGGGLIATDLALTEGETYLLRVTATDAHGNLGTSLSYLRIGVPFDDSNVGMEYQGDWSAIANASYFGGGYHVTSTPGDTMTFTFTTDGSLGLTHVSFLGGPGDGQAMWSDGISENSIVETPSTPVSAYLGGFLFTQSGTYTMTLTVTSGTIIIDAIAVVMS